MRSRTLHRQLTVEYGSREPPRLRRLLERSRNRRTPSLLCPLRRLTRAEGRPPTVAGLVADRHRVISGRTHDDVLVDEFLARRRCEVPFRQKGIHIRWRWSIPCPVGLLQRSVLAKRLLKVLTRKMASVRHVSQSPILVSLPQRISISAKLEFELRSLLAASEGYGVKLIPPAGRDARSDVIVCDLPNRRQEAQATSHRR